MKSHQANQLCVIKSTNQNHVSSIIQQIKTMYQVSQQIKTMYHQVSQLIKTMYHQVIQ